LEVAPSRARAVIPNPARSGVRDLLYRDLLGTSASKDQISTAFSGAFGAPVRTCALGRQRRGAVVGACATVALRASTKSPCLSYGGSMRDSFGGRAKPCARCHPEPRPQRGEGSALPRLAWHKRQVPAGTKSPPLAGVGPMTAAPKSSATPHRAQDVLSGNSAVRNGLPPKGKKSRPISSPVVERNTAGLRRDPERESAVQPAASALRLPRVQAPEARLYLARHEARLPARRAERSAGYPAKSSQSRTGRLKAVRVLA